jgi:hypothetical protein
VGGGRRMLEFSQTNEEWNNSPMSQKCMFNIILSSLHVGFTLRFARPSQGAGTVGGFGAEIRSQEG